MLTLEVSLSGPQASRTRIVLQGLFRHNSGPKAVRGSAVYGWPEGGVGTVWGGWFWLRSLSRALPLRRFGVKDRETGGGGMILNQRNFESLAQAVPPPLKGSSEYK